MLLSYFLLSLPLSGSWMVASVAAAATNTPHIVVDSSAVTGRLKNLQGTNNAVAPTDSDATDQFDDQSPQMHQHWKDSAVEHVCICEHLIGLMISAILTPGDSFPDVFLGGGQKGSAGDAYNISNYNFTNADARVKFVVSGGVKASAQFEEGSHFNMTQYTLDQMEGMGYMITDRYLNGAHKSGFRDAIELWDFYPEADLLYTPGDTSYNNSLAYYSAFANGVARASTKAGVGAWGLKRLWTPSASYTLPDPWKTQFYSDVAKNKVPIKAATFHWDASMLNWNPYELVRATAQFRELYLVPAGLSDLPIWVTEHNRTPLRILPTTAESLASYWDPASFASWIVAVAMYGQDADVEQAWSWPGMGYGGYGYGEDYFQAWYNKTGHGDVPLNAASAWVLSGQMVTKTPDRLELAGSSSNGFSALAGISPNRTMVQVMLNNYQVDYTMLEEITAAALPLLDTSANCTKQPVLQPDGLYNGEQICMLTGGSSYGMLTFTQPFVRDNTATAYDLEIVNLPWGEKEWHATVQRVGGGQTHQIYKSIKGRGNKLDLALDFPPNAQDLITVSPLQ